MAETGNVHGTAIEIEGLGVLIRGASGAGKSLLALDLLDHFSGRGLSAHLIADDRVLLAPAKEGLRLSPPQAVAGMIELRGRGIVRRAYRQGVILRLIVDLEAEIVRLPDPGAFSTALLGVEVARCAVPARAAGDPVHQRLLVSEAVMALREPR